MFVRRMPRLYDLDIPFRTLCTIAYVTNQDSVREQEYITYGSSHAGID